MKSLITVTLLLCAFSSTILAKNPTSEEKRLSPLIKRTLACVQSANNPKASCTVEAEGEKVRPADCFEEVSKEDKKPRMYCKISCKNGPVGVVVVEKQPSGVRQCVKHFTYNTERRGNEWYLWRSADCLNQTVTFEVGLEDTFCE